MTMLYAAVHESGCGSAPRRREKDPPGELSIDPVADAGNRMGWSLVTKVACARLSDPAGRKERCRKAQATAPILDSTST
jgi:hypothetical protein